MLNLQRYEIPKLKIRNTAVSEANSLNIETQKDSIRSYGAPLLPLRELVDCVPMMRCGVGKLTWQLCNVPTLFQDPLFLLLPESNKKQTPLCAELRVIMPAHG